MDSLKQELGDTITPVCLDLANWRETSDKLKSFCDDVDFLINNAAFCVINTIDNQQEEDLNRILDVNVKAPINLIRLVSAGMKRRKFGSIVNVSSVAGIAALDLHCAYGSSKAALDMVTKVAAKELGPFNIRVNSVNPTVVWTQMGALGWNEPKKKETMIAKIPMGRFVEVSEVIEPILFLLSSRSSMINGIMMPIDGGFVAC